jgi:hypothetical protein
VTTTKDQIATWLAKGRDKQATHMLVVCDTFDESDYPVYVLKDDDVVRIVKIHNEAPMTVVQEVYSYSHNLDAQLAEPRARHLD